MSKTGNTPNSKKSTGNYYKYIQDSEPVALSSKDPAARINALMSAIRV